MINGHRKKPKAITSGGVGSVARGTMYFLNNTLNLILFDSFCITKS